MEDRQILILLLSAIAVAMMFRHHQAIAEAIRRGPWNGSGGGGGLGPTGPAPAADPNMPPWKRRKRAAR